MNTDLDLWRARALRYTLIYVLLACVLVTLRYQTRAVRPELLRLTEQRVELQQRKDALELSVQSLNTRARDWALGSGMQPFSRSPNKQTAAFTPLPEPAILPAATPPEVRTQWN